MIINPNQYQLDWTPTTPAASTTFQMTLAATYFAVGFVPQYSKTINEIRIFFSAKAGTVTAGNITCSLYSSAAGVPNSQVDINTNSPSYTAATWHDFTGFNTALTGQTQYWAVFKNLQGTPASNNVTALFGTAGALPISGGQSVKYGWPEIRSTDSGATWTSGGAAGAAYIRIKYSDGSYEGFPIQGVATGAVGKGIFGTTELGTKLLLPGNSSLTYNITGLQFYIRSITGTPTGNLRLRLYSGTSSTPTRLGTTSIIPVSEANALPASYITCYFSAPIAVAGGTTIRAVCGTDGSDTNSNRYNSVEYTWDSDSNSLLLMPNGAVQTYSTDGTTFAEASSNLINPFAIVLDPIGGEFTVSGGSHGQRRPFP